MEEWEEEREREEVSSRPHTDPLKLFVQAAFGHIAFCKVL